MQRLLFSLKKKQTKNERTKTKQEKKSDLNKNINIHF